MYWCYILFKICRQFFYPAEGLDNEMMDKRASLLILVIVWTGMLLYYCTVTVNDRSCHEAIVHGDNLDSSKHLVSRISLLESLDQQHDNNESMLQQYNRNENQNGQISYALSLRYMDQITCGARRVRSLQCWAKQLTRIMRVVQPSVNGSYFGPPLKNPVAGIQRFGDIFDIDWWNYQGTELAKYLPMATWEELFIKAPRKTILINFLYQDDPRCFENPPPNSTCKLDEVRRFWLENLKPFSFSVIREVCINFRDSDVFDQHEFNRIIFGNISVNTPVTLVFNDWRGPLGRAPKRKPKHEFNALLRYRDVQCTPVTQVGFVRNLTRISLRPIPETFHSAEVYATTYLDTNTNYVAIMVRWELILLEHVYWAHAFKGPPNDGTTCKNKILEHLQEMYLKEGIHTSFLATDAGRYGSRVLQPNVSFHGEMYEEPARKHTEEILKALTDKPMTLEQYDQHFADFAESTGHSIYVPQFQKAIAARAKCLLLVGWGTFHENTLALYMQRHKGKVCYKNIRSC